MNLHLRVLIGYHLLVGLLVLCAAGAALGFHQQQEALQQGVGQASVQVQGTLAVLSQLDAHDALLRRALYGDAAARTALPRSWAEVEGRVEAAIALPEGLDSPVAAHRDLRWTLARYHQVAEDLLTAVDLRGDAAETRLQDYETRVGDAFRTLKSQTYALVEANLKTTRDSEGSVESTSKRYAAIYASLLVLALITVAFLSRQLRRGLVDRLVATATVAQAVADGDKTRRANSGPDDELGIIGRQLNALLDTEQALHAEMEGRLCQQRQLLLGLSHSWPKPVALFTIYGDLTVSTLDDQDREAIEAAELKFPDPPTYTADDRPFEVTAGGRQIHCRLLRVAGRRPVGWLAEVA